MNAEQIRAEYQKNGRISGKAMTSLRALLRESDDPYAAITLTGDVGAFQLAEDIVPYLRSADSMLRWNAAAVLFTRFREVRLGRQCLELLNRELDTLVRGVALVGAGELLPLIENRLLQQQLASKLLKVMEAEDEFPEMRGSAYLGVEAAVGIPPTDRSPADRLLDPKKDFQQHVVNDFRSRYGI
jgi:hypothetical protein